jgi:hypothetical protein
VRAYSDPDSNPAGPDGSYTPKKSGTTILPPAEDLTVSEPSSTSATISWGLDSYSTALGFHVFTDDGSGFTQVDTVSPSTTIYQFTSLSSSFIYAFRVEAYNDDLSSGVAEVHEPAPPTGLSATVTVNGSGHNQVALSWGSGSTHSEGYDVERSDDGGVTFQHLSYVALGTHAYTDTDSSSNRLIDNFRYIYRVRAYDSNVNDGAPALINVNVHFGTTHSPAIADEKHTGSLVQVADGADGMLINTEDMFETIDE